LILNMVMPTLEQMISSQRFNHPRGAWRKDYCNIVISSRRTSTMTDHRPPTTAGHQLHVRHPRYNTSWSSWMLYVEMLGHDGGFGCTSRRWWVSECAHET
jgi:hypothetical protein